MEMIGKHVIIRTFSAGVHTGTLKSLNGHEAVLTNARRLWYWEGAFTLNAVAMAGASKNSKLSVPVDEILLTEAIEVIPMTREAVESLNGIKNHEPR